MALRLQGNLLCVFLVRRLDATLKLTRRQIRRVSSLSTAMWLRFVRCTERIQRYTYDDSSCEGLSIEYGDR
jgi:hypothetical protein